MFGFFFFFKQKTAYEILRSDWSSDVCSSDLLEQARGAGMGLRIGQREGGGQGAVVMFATLLGLPRQKPAVPARIERPVPADKGAFAGMFQAVTPFDGLLGKARAVVRTKRQFGDILARHQRPKPRRGAIRLLGGGIGGC